MSTDDLMRQANTLAEKLRRARDTSRQQGRAPDTHDLARLASLWTAIRAARAGGPEHGAEQRTRPKWDAAPPRGGRR
jgi:hypothetical protein